MLVSGSVIPALGLKLVNVTYFGLFGSLGSIIVGFQIWSLEWLTTSDVGQVSVEKFGLNPLLGPLAELSRCSCSEPIHPKPWTLN